MFSWIGVQRTLAWMGLGVLLVGLLLLSGCGKQSEDQKDAGGTVTLEFWTLQLNTFEPYIQAMILAYEADHPNIKIRWIDVPFSQGEKRAVTAMMSPSMPDVVNLNPDFSAVLASRQAVLDMGQWVPQETRGTYLPVAWDASTMPMADGSRVTFGLPWYISSKVTLYNKAVLERAGVSAVPDSYEALEAVAQTLGPKKGAVLMPALADHGFFFKEMLSAGIPLYDAQGRAVFADHGAAEHLAFWKRLFDARLIPAESLSEGNQAAVDRYQSGALAMLMTGPNFLNIVKENAPKVYETTGVAPQFPKGSGYTDFSTMVLVVPRRSRHPKEAVEFALYVTNAANQLRFCDEAPILPSQAKALEELIARGAKADDPADAGRLMSAKQLQGAQRAYTIRPGQNQLNQWMDYYVQSALLGKLSTQEAMAQAQERVNQILSDQGVLAGHGPETEGGRL